MQRYQNNLHLYNKMVNRIPEEELIAGCIRGEMSARKRLYELYAPAMMGLCMRYLSDRELAQDILQDGFIKIYTKIRTYSGTGSFEGWMKKVFISTILEHFRNNKKKSTDFRIDDYSHLSDEKQCLVIDQLSADEILKIISELPEGFRTVFNLYAIEGYSHSEISKLMGIKESTSRSQFTRARQLLQKKIESITKHGNARSAT